jgi:hypothetical protein
MTNPRQHPNGPSKPQLKLLKRLAEETGETFIWPRSPRAAGEEIERLLDTKPTSRTDRRRESAQLSDDLATKFGDAASVRDDELAGYGSTASWAGHHA